MKRRKPAGIAFGSAAGLALLGIVQAAIGNENTAVLLAVCSMIMLVCGIVHLISGSRP